MMQNCRHHLDLLVLLVSGGGRLIENRGSQGRLLGGGEGLVSDPDIIGRIRVEQT